MERLQHALDVVDSAEVPAVSVAVLFGDDDFLKRLTLEKLVAHLAPHNDDDAPPFVRCDGEKCEWRDVKDELSTVSLFGGGTNFVFVERCDTFVTRHREQLERLVESGVSRGILVLEVKTWSRVTRLAKLVEKVGLAVNCKAPESSQGQKGTPDVRRIAQWFEVRAKSVHEFEFARGAAEELVELVGPIFGLIDQQLAKLALFAGRGGKVTKQMVIDYVGGWKTKTTWDLLDAITEGNAAEALLQLDHLLHAGDVPIALHGAFIWSLRRFAAATREVQRMERAGERVNLREALVRGGFRNYGREIEKAESHLKRIGRARAGALFQQLAQCDLQLKGSHSSADRARWALERTILELAREAVSSRAAAAK